MTLLASAFNSGDNMSSRTKLMLSLVPLWFMIMVASELVSSSPVTDRLTKRTPREDHQNNPEINKISNDMFLSKKYLNFVTGIKFPDVAREMKWSLSSPSASHSYDPSTPAYFGPKLVYKEFVYNKRRKRELRTSSRVSSSSNVPSKSSNYHPFLMAEMIPGTVKTRHPSIIAVNGCPAYYIADHKGQCRQVFQYTVNFGQRLPRFNSPSPSPPPKHTIHLKNFYMHRERSPQSSTTTAAPQISRVPGRPIPVVHEPHSSPPSSSPRLLMLLRNAAKRFDLTFLKNQSSSNSGEALNDDKIDKLRRKILSALKITKNKEFPKEESRKQDKDRRNSNSNSATSSTITTTTSTTSTSTTTTTPDYDD